MNISVFYADRVSFDEAERWIVDALSDWSEGEFDPEEDLFDSFTGGSIHSDHHHNAVYVDGYISRVGEDEFRVSVDVTGNGDIMEFNLPTSVVSRVEIDFPRPRRRRRKKNPPPTLEQASIEELREIARAHRVKATGTRDHLIRRIRSIESRRFPAKPRPKRRLRGVLE